MGCATLTRTVCVLTAGVLASATAFAREEDSNGANSESQGRRFEVTVTNLTKGQQFTPILIASHLAA